MATPKRELPLDSGGVIEPGMCGRSLRENRETSVGSNPSDYDGGLDDVGKVNSRTPIAHATEESDGGHSTEDASEQRDSGLGGFGRGKGIDQEELDTESREPNTKPGLCVEWTASSASKSVCFDAKYSR